ncbi:MAG: prepilin peptidase [Rhodospirillales bacterium]|nr:prepilin peptidase [Rhodospirillales bacterium]MCB9996740.1 prepilin peptidase [Rhodospirillales bacterium]
MLSWIAFISEIGGLTLLFCLAAVDLKTRLLPNEMVLGFATLGVIFHLTSMAEFVTPANAALGGIIGFSMLYIIRAAANRIYKADALGLGDVKLIGAGGIWVGPDMIMLAMAIGAFAGLIHGFGYAMRQSRRTGQKPDFARLQIPAGPGFAIGIGIAIIYKFWNFSPLL